METTITLRGLTWDRPRGYAPLFALADTYRAAHPEVAITWETGPFVCSSHDRLDELAERYDLLIFDHPLVGFAVARSCLLPLERHVTVADLEVLAEQSVGASHASYVYEDQLWALAIDAAAQVSAYRPDLMADAVSADLPRTWDDVLALGRTLRRRGLGYLALPSGGVNAMMSFLTLCANAGEDPCPPHGDRVASPTTARYALEMLRELFSLSHPAALEWGPPQTLDHMSRHDDVIYCPLLFGYSNYARDGFAPHLVRCTTIPAAGARGCGGAILGGTGIGVSAHCRRPDIAATLACWLCSADIQRGPYVMAGGQPGNRSAWVDPAANAACHDFFTDTLATLDDAYLRPRYDGFVAFQDQAGELLQQYLRDADALGTVDAMLDTLDQLYRASQPVGDAAW